MKKNPSRSFATKRKIISNTSWFILVILFFAMESFSYSKNNDYKTLYLLRHAKSSWEDSTMLDIDRPLNDRGFTDAPTMGKRLHKMGIFPDVIIASPSKRTTQTIELVCKEIKFDFSKVVWDSTIYRCADEDMMKAILNIDNKFKSAMIVGHNNTITNLANKFQADTLIEEVPTCGIVAIQFETTQWNQINSKKGKLLFFEYPKKK